MAPFFSSQRKQTVESKEMQTFRIALLPGDGIGPDVVAEGVKVLRVVERELSEVRFDCKEFSVGAGEFLRSGDP